jgi:hypothetical protein
MLSAFQRRVIAELERLNAEYRSFQVGQAPGAFQRTQQFYHL